MKELKHIFLIEDEADIRAVATIALEQVGGLSVTGYTSGEEVLRQLEKATPDLILLDVMMPGMDGPEVLGRLQNMAPAKDIPVVFMTAKVQPQEVAHFKSLGAVDVIAKPFDPMTLAEQIKEIWQRYTGG